MTNQCSPAENCSSAFVLIGYKSVVSPVRIQFVDKALRLVEIVVVCVFCFSKLIDACFFSFPNSPFPVGTWTCEGSEEFDHVGLFARARRIGHFGSIFAGKDFASLEDSWPER